MGGGVMTRRKRRGLFMKLLLAAIVLQVIAYMWACAYWSRLAGFEIAPVQSAAFYAFCGFECGVCGYIKNRSEKKKENEHDV